MPNQDGVCIDKIKNCEIPLEDQPKDLETDSDGNYFCEECLDSFGWDEETGQCLSCSLSFCSECKFSSGRPACETCVAGYMLDENEVDCVKLDPNCVD